MHARRNLVYLQQIQPVQQTLSRRSRPAENERIHMGVNCMKCAVGIIVLITFVLRIRSSLRHKKERKRAGSDAGQCSEIDRSLASSSTPFDYSSNGYLLDDLQQDDHVEIDFGII